MCKRQTGHDKIYNIDLIGVIEGRKKRGGQKQSLKKLNFFLWKNHATDPRGTRNPGINTKKIIAFLGVNSYISKIKMIFECLKYSKFTSPQIAEMYLIYT